MIATPLQQDTTCPRHLGLPIQTTDLRCMTNDVERRGQFVEEQVWFVPAGSPTLAQLVQNCRRRPKMSGLSGLPGCGQRVVQGAALVVVEVITFVVSNQIQNRAFG